MAERYHRRVLAADVVCPQIIAQVEQFFELAYISLTVADYLFQFLRKVLKSIL
jgi:hypothetical protein